jgi:hypothetical protein
MMLLLLRTLIELWHSTISFKYLVTRDEEEEEKISINTLEINMKIIQAERHKQI